MRIESSIGLCLFAALALGQAGCKREGGNVALSKQAPLDVDDGTIPNVPVPEENGPKLVALKEDVPVYERPATAAPVIGALRFGGAVARANEPFKKTADCEPGWYPVRPRGFVCGDASVKLDGAELSSAPDTQKALPYRYASVKSVTPLYARAPTAAEQIENEPSLERHLKKVASAEPTKLRASANDVPLDERGVATGPAVVTPESEGVSAEGHRTAQSFFDFGGDKALPAIPPRDGLVALVLRRGSVVALTGTVSVEGPHGPRRFGVTPEANLVPLDRVDPALGSVWHGVDLTKEKGLPLAFVLRHEVCPYELGKGKAKRLEDDEHEKRAVIHLTGRFRTVESVQYDESEEGVWFRSKDLIKVVKRTKFPDFVEDSSKWVDVSLALQTMTLYEGKKPVYATLISSGKDVLGDPETSAATKLGTYSVTVKAATRTLDPREVDQTFDVQHAPYYLEYSPGFALTGSIWSDPQGEARGYHNIALTPVDAHRVYSWSGPELPTGFRWLAQKPDETITIHVRK